MKLDSRSFDLGKITGLLEAFQTINHKTNHSFSFDLIFVPKEGKSELLIIEGYFLKYFKSFEVELIDNPRSYLQGELKSWFFEYLPNNNSGSYSFIDPAKDFSLSDYEEQDRYTKEWTELMMTTLNPQKVYTLKDCLPVGFYACEYSNILFVTEEIIYILHLSWSD
jgi:hypothetical protein